MLAPKGTIYVCAACGKTCSDRDRFKDASCRTWAVLCGEATLVRDPVTGLVTGGKAVDS